MASLALSFSTNNTTSPQLQQQQAVSRFIQLNCLADTSHGHPTYYLKSPDLNPLLRRKCFLGKGAGGLVYKLYLDGQAIAIKKQVYTSQTSLQRIQTEVEIFKRIKSCRNTNNYSFVINYLGDYYGQPGAAYIGEHYTMFELADENLFDVLERLDHDDSEDDCFEKFICLMKQVFYQLAWLAKDAHVTHNDLYTSNIMCIEAESDMVVNIDGPFAAHNTQNTTIQLHIKEGWPIVKIIDFGIASIVDKYNGFDYVRDNLQLKVVDHQDLENQLQSSTKLLDVRNIFENSFAHDGMKHVVYYDMPVYMRDVCAFILSLYVREWDDQRIQSWVDEASKHVQAVLSTSTATTTDSESTPTPTKCLETLEWLCNSL